MASVVKKKRSSPSTSRAAANETVLHEGWCVKESGTVFLGRTNWRKRWFRLVQRHTTTTLQYFRSKSDKQPAGSVRLDVTYCTRQLEVHEKSQPNCFAVGPLVDDGAVRTYYISCPTQLAMQEWMAVIDAAIQGVPEQAQRRRQTINYRYSIRAQKKLARERDLGSHSSRDSALGAVLESASLELSCSMQGNPMGAEDSGLGATVDDALERDDLSDEEVWDIVEDEVSDEDEELAAASLASSRLGRASSPDSALKPTARLRLYGNQAWRLERWKELCETLKTAKWSKIDTKEGVTVARCKFGRNSKGHAVMKIEGVLPADPATVYQFLQLSMREGGKLDYLFRNENFIEEFEAEPCGMVISNHFLLPLPRISTREVVAMKLWVPDFLTTDGKSGFVMFSVDHPYAPMTEKDVRRINVDPSGLVLSMHPGPGGVVHTHATILVQVALYGALHRMLKGAYNSGLLKLGLRSTFTHIAEQLQRFVEITNI